MSAGFAWGVALGVFTTMLSIGVLGYLSDRLVVVVRNRALRWHALEAYGG